MGFLPSSAFGLIDEEGFAPHQPLRGLARYGDDRRYADVLAYGQRIQGERRNLYADPTLAALRAGVAQLRARLARRRLWPLFCQQRRGHGSNPPVATNDFESCGFRTRPPTLSRARHYSPHRHRRADHPDSDDVFGQFRYVATLWLVGQLLGLDRPLYGQRVRHVPTPPGFSRGAGSVGGRCPARWLHRAGISVALPAAALATDRARFRPRCLGCTLERLFLAADRHQSRRDPNAAHRPCHVRDPGGDNRLESADGCDVVRGGAYVGHLLCISAVFHPQPHARWTEALGIFNGLDSTPV